MNISRLIASLNDYYWRCLQPPETREKMWEDRVNSLLHFTVNYAFERRGSPQIYRIAARKAIESHRKQLANLRGADNWRLVERSVLKEFRAVCDEASVPLNSPRNPMTRAGRGRYSVVGFALRIANNGVLANWAKKLIEEGPKLINTLLVFCDPR